MERADAKVHGDQGNGHWRLVGKIVSSFLGFGAVFGFTQALPDAVVKGNYWSYGAGLFMAGVIFVVQYLMEVERRLDHLEVVFERHVDDTRERLERHAQITETQISDGFSRIHLASELFGLGEASQLQPEEMREMTRLVRNSTRISSDSSTLVQDFAQLELTRLSGYLKQLGDGGDLTYEGEDRDWMLGLTQVATTTIRATSLSTVDAGGQGFTDGGLWGMDLGQRYLDVQHQASQRGVQIQRIFIFDRSGLPLDDLRWVLKQHLIAGVEVRTLDATTATGMFPRLRDFIIFDDVLSYQSTLAAAPFADRSPIIVDTTLVTLPERVNTRLREFEQLWNSDEVQKVTLGPNGEVLW